MRYLRQGGDKVYLGAHSRHVSTETIFDSDLSDSILFRNIFTTHLQFGGCLQRRHLSSQMATQELLPKFYP